MHFTTDHRGRLPALAPAALLLLALCLLAGNAQALTDSPALVVSEPGRYTLDHDISTGAAVGVLINGSDVILDGMGHRVTGTGRNGSVGVLVSGRTAIAEGEMGTNVTVRNLTVSGWDDGIRIGQTSGTVVERVVAEKNAVGLVISASTGITDNHVVRDSVFSENTGTVLRGKGVLLSYPAQGITIERCEITDNSGGVYADLVHAGSVPNTLVDSLISHNAGDGLYSHDGSFSVVRNCTVSANGDDGIEFEHGGAEIVGNRIEENVAAGVDVSERGGSDIHGNWITGNGFGILDGGDWPSHVRNNYLNNTDNGFFRSNGDVGALNYTTSAGPNIIGGPYLGGNVWAHPNGTGFSQTHTDTDGDGFCDEPYPVTEDAVDYLPLALQAGTPTPTPTPAPPFGGWPFTPLTVPGRIQAEDYNLGGPGPAYRDTTSGNSGGAYRADDVDIEVQGGTTNVGWIRDGEYLTYTANVTAAGEYTMTARVASPNSGRTIAVTTYGNGVSGAPVGTIAVPNTGSFATFREVGVPVTLVAGTHEFRLTFSGDGQNLDWFELSPSVEPTPTPTVTPTPEIDGTPYKPLSIPGTIQAEDYDLGGEGVASHDTTSGNGGGAYRADDVDIEVQGGTTNVGWIRDGEYLRYTVNVAQTGDYYMALRVASPHSYRNVVVLVDDGWQEMWVLVPNTGSFERFATAVEWSTRTRPSAGVTATMTPAPTTTGGFTFGKNPVHLSAGTHTLTLRFVGDGQNLDWIEFTAAEPASGGIPYKPLSIPGTIQAEDYDLGGQNVGYSDTTTGNSGGTYRHDDVDIEVGGSGYDVGWIREGEWLTYTADVASAGQYTLTARVASPNSGRTILVLVDDRSVATIAVPRTGSFSAWQTASVQVPLAAGQHTLRLMFTGDGQNIDWIAFNAEGTTPPITPTPEGGGGSFSAVPTTAPHGSAVKFTVTPAAGKAIASAWWSFDAPAHLNTWNSRNVNPTFFYPWKGTFSPLVTLSYTDGSTETVQRTNYVRAT